MKDKEILSYIKKYLVIKRNIIIVHVTICYKRINGCFRLNRKKEFLDNCRFNRLPSKMGLASNRSYEFLNEL